MSTKTHTSCKNCGTENEGAYCSNCGQRSSVDKVTFKETFTDFASSLFSLNAPLIITLKYLIINPGHLFREFLEGKRKKYYKPVAFFVLTTIVYLVMRAIIDFDPTEDSSLIGIDVDTGSGKTIVQKFLLNNLDKLLLALVFTNSLFLKLLFFRRNAWAEFVAISFYLIGVYTIFTTMNMFFLKYIDTEMRAGSLILMLLYFCYAIISFYPRYKLLVFLQAFVAYALGIIAFLFVTLGLAYIWIEIF